LTESK